MLLMIVCNLTGSSTTNSRFEFKLPFSRTWSFNFHAVGSCLGDLNEILDIQNGGGGSNTINFRRIAGTNFPAFTVGTQLLCNIAIPLTL